MSKAEKNHNVTVEYLKKGLVPLRKKLKQKQKEKATLEEAKKFYDDKRCIIHDEEDLKKQFPEQKELADKIADVEKEIKECENLIRAQKLRIYLNQKQAKNIKNLSSLVEDLEAIREEQLEIDYQNFLNKIFAENILTDTTFILNRESIKFTLTYEPNAEIVIPKYSNEARIKKDKITITINGHNYQFAGDKELANKILEKFQSYGLYIKINNIRSVTPRKKSFTLEGKYNDLLNMYEKEKQYIAKEDMIYKDSAAYNLEKKGIIYDYVAKQTKGFSSSNEIHNPDKFTEEIETRAQRSLIYILKENEKINPIGQIRVQITSDPLHRKVYLRYNKTDEETPYRPTDNIEVFKSSNQKEVLIALNIVRKYLERINLLDKYGQSFVTNVSELNKALQVKETPTDTLAEMLNDGIEKVIGTTSTRPRRLSRLEATREREEVKKVVPLVIQQIKEKLAEGKTDELMIVSIKNSEYKVTVGELAPYMEALEENKITLEDALYKLGYLNNYTNNGQTRH